MAVFENIKHLQVIVIIWSVGRKVRWNNFLQTPNEVEDYSLLALKSLNIFKANITWQTITSIQCTVYRFSIGQETFFLLDSSDQLCIALGNVLGLAGTVSEYNIDLTYHLNRQHETHENFPNIWGDLSANDSHISFATILNRNWSVFLGKWKIKWI